MAKTKKISIVVAIEYSYADDSDANSICAESMMENVRAVLEDQRASGNLTPDDICAEKLSCELRA